MAAMRLTVYQWACACLLWLLLTSGNCFDLACIEVKKSFALKGFNENDVPIQAISGEHLEICPQGNTCCTQEMEGKLQSLSKKEHLQQMNEAYKLIKVTFSSRTKKFNEFFTELLENARKDLNEMFVKTYGLLYVQNSKIFTDLFVELRRYYEGADINLMDVMNNFFSSLLQKMFQLLNKDYDFNNKYMECVTERMDELQPFGDVPLKLSIQVKRAFIAARTFVQGLAIGRDVVLNVMEVPSTESCTKALMKMTYCPHCRGLTLTKPCNNYCLNTMKGCLAYQTTLNSVWNEYIEAMKMLASRLEGPFNIESVVDPIDVKISDAIMNLQENSTKVSVQIFAGCGKPKVGRKKRETEEYNFNFDRPRKQPKPTTAAGTNLDRLVKDIREKVKTAKDFWHLLPYTLCNNEEMVAGPGNQDDCWNGQDRARYIPDVQKDGVVNQINNPEVEVDVSKVNSVVSRQVIQLKLMTSRLHNAYNGLDVEWIETDIGGYSGSGSGDGHSDGGDGVGIDDEDMNAGSGSGVGPVPDGTNDNIDIDNNPPYTTNNNGKPPKRHPNRPRSTERPRGGNPSSAASNSIAIFLFTSIYVLGRLLTRS